MPIRHGPLSVLTPESGQGRRWLVPCDCFWQPCNNIPPPPGAKLVSCPTAHTKPLLWELMICRGRVYCGCEGAKGGSRTNHNQGAGHRHALARPEPLRVGAAGHDQRGRCRQQWHYRLPWYGPLPANRAGRDMSLTDSRVPDNDGEEDEGHRLGGGDSRGVQGACIEFQDTGLATLPNRCGLNRSSTATTTALSRRRSCAMS